MDVKDLKYFVAAYEAKSFSEATTALGTVQSNVSLRIRNLEDFLGVSLFVRTRRNVVPTTQGDVLYRHAKTVLAAMDETERALRTTLVA
ncbi:MAG: LysR family transcriptional regulator [Burkholderiales bacterium]